jgi:selenoprotein W-related protein
LAAAIREAYPGADVTLTASGGGVFEVALDGRPLFSKRTLGRHAQPGEILGLIRDALGNER